MLVLELPKDTTVDKQLDKVAEEFKEFVDAVMDDDTNEELLSEFYDAVQAMIGILDLKGISLCDIRKGEKNHIKKMESRGWKIKNKVIL
jgi:phosphoribosyl-ATP pyrophosphohydrolase